MSIATTFYLAAYNSTVIFIVVDIISVFFSLHSPINTKAHWLPENKKILVTNRDCKLF